MTYLRRVALACALLAVSAWQDAGAAERSPQDQPVDFPTASLEFFEKQVRPLLVRRCYECHSGQAEKIQGGLRLDSRDFVLAGGETAPAAVPGEVDQSLLIDAVRYGDLYQMPPKSKLPDAELAVLERWVALGLPWPAEEPPKVAAQENQFDLAARRAAHWAWQPVAAADPPAVRDADWPLTAFDRFILAGLERRQLSPAPPAGKRTLVRRAYFDAIGLPPTAEEVERFVADERPDAYQRLVDRLLDSPHFGERWARHWLDLVRYAESRGHEFDYDIPNVHQYRDYVIRALNADVPYDQFLREHIAGDLLDPPRRHPVEGFNESVLGTGFWFLGEWVHSPVDIRQDEADRFDNMVDVFSKAFLGMTVACARCHDHKFDAISQRDYYALCGFLQSSAYRQVRFESLETNRQVAERLETLRTEYRGRVAAQLSAKMNPVVQQLDSYLLAAGDVLQPADDSPLAQLSEAERVERVAGQRQLDAEVLQAWVEHLQQARANAADPFHAWARQVLEAPIVTAHDQLPETSDASTEPPSNDAAIARPYKTIVDYAAADSTAWIADGPTFGAGPVPPGTVLLPEDAQQSVRVAGYGAARRDPFWNRLEMAPGTQNDQGRLNAWVRAGRTLRTPTFTIETGRVFYRVKGRFLAYAVVDSHRMINGPLHGGLLKEVKTEGNSPVWVEHDLSAYVGHDGHLEFTAVGDEPLEVLAVVQSEQAPPDAESELLSALNRLAVRTAEATAAAIAGQQARYCQETLFRFARGSVAAFSDAGERAALIAWMIARPQLFRAGQLGLQPDEALLTEYARRREELAERARWQSRTAPAMWDGSGRDERLLIRGNPRTPGHLVPRRSLEALRGDATLHDGTGSGRLQLARQLTSDANPLVSRVIVNRVVHHLFGRGIVSSTDNFGVLGERPTHPELLDHLAAGFVDDGWSLKRLIRSLMLSQTYRMSSESERDVEQQDPENRWWHRMPVRRLDAESIRDAVLAVSGRLQRDMYGRSVPVHLTPFMQGRGRPGESGPVDGDGRRSIYIAIRRNFLSPMMLAFDAPIPFTTMGKRNVSNVPAQALILMNDPFVVEQAGVWARRVLEQTPHAMPEQRIRLMYQQAFARPPRGDELTAARDFLQAQAEQLELPADATDEDPRLWADFAHALLNVKEFIFVY